MIYFEFNYTIKMEKKMIVKAKLMILIMCLVGTTAFLTAQEDVELGKYPECRLYNVAANSNTHKHFEEVFDKIGSLTSLIAIIDKNGGEFDLKQPTASALNLRYNMVVWDGYLYCRKAGIYTFILFPWSIPFANNYRGAFGITVNDKSKVVKEGEKNVYQDTFDVDLKLGYNKVRLCFFVFPSVAIAKPKNPLIKYKPRNALDDYRAITPSLLFHKIPEKDW